MCTLGQERTHEWLLAGPTNDVLRGLVALQLAFVALLCTLDSVTLSLLLRFSSLTRVYAFRRLGADDPRNFRTHVAHLPACGFVRKRVKMRGVSNLAIGHGFNPLLFPTEPYGHIQPRRPAIGRITNPIGHWEPYMRLVP